MIRGIQFGITALLLVSCQGVIGDGGFARGSDGNRGPNGGGVGVPSESTLKRLTKEQHRNTVESLLVEFLGSDAGPVLDAVDPVYAIIPEDTADLSIGGLVGATFSRMAQSVGELHIRGYFDVAMTAADSIAFDEGRRVRMFGDCFEAPEQDHAACLDEFLGDFGLWAMRRPMTAEERDFFIDVVFADDGRSYVATPEALRDVLVTLLTSPNFLYLVNTEGAEVGNGVYELDGYELASRLSYHFWDSMPDQELLDAAADGTLLTPNGYAEQVDRVYADPRTGATFRRFVYEWLELYETGDVYGGVSSGDVQKMTFIAGYKVTPALREEMNEEVLDMVEYYRLNGTFEDLFTSNDSFAKSEDLAAIYDVAVWDGQSMPVPFPTPERQGLLGRAALLASATVTTHPILRGVRIREDLMCDELGAPPDDVNDVEQDFQALATTRQRTESLTSPGSCAGCHILINGLGFPLEAFDSLGRYRSEEMYIDVEGSVELLPLDLESAPFVASASDPTVVDGPAELTDAILSSGKLEECFARHYVRFTLGLLADPAYGGDSETVRALADELRAGGPLSDAFKSIAFLPAFKQRVSRGNS
jgi:hypothetical protein